MDKIELLNKIDNIPLFVKDKVNVERDGQQYEQRDFAICEETSPKAICYVSPRYNLMQFHSVFKPIVEQFDECNGRIYYYGGMAIMDLFPKDIKEQTLFQHRESRIGITIANSVDKTSAVAIKFCVLYKPKGDKVKVISIPKGVAGFRKTHSSRHLMHIARDYTDIIVKIKDTWKNVITEFPKYKFDNVQDFVDIVNGMKFTDTMKRYLVYKYKYALIDKKSFSLWDLFNLSINYVLTKSYTSEIHKRKHLDEITDKILTYNFTFSI